MRVWRRCRDTDRSFWRTVLELTTSTGKVWPLVPGFSWSTFPITGFLFPCVAPALPSCCCCARARVC
uniref:Uncharacterized protein n=1 Tax=Rhizophora mucronata TaxID=61149 RepID=A0A2P2P993_RHIMU